MHYLRPKLFSCRISCFRDEPLGFRPGRCDYDSISYPSVTPSTLQPGSRRRDHWRRWRMLYQSKYIYINTISPSPGSRRSNRCRQLFTCKVLGSRLLLAWPRLHRSLPPHAYVRLGAVAFRAHSAPGRILKRSTAFFTSWRRRGKTSWHMDAAVPPCPS